MTPCEETTWWRNHDGYGKAMREGVSWKSHRYAWTQTYGPIPNGLYVLHHCDNPPCILVVGDPALDHLYLGTQAQNVADREARGRTHRGPLEQSRGAHHWSAKRPNHRPSRGVKNGNAKLITRDVVAIRDQVAQGKSQSKVATAFGISQTQVGRICRGERWGHVGGQA